LDFGLIPASLRQASGRQQVNQRWNCLYRDPLSGKSVMNDSGGYLPVLLILAALLLFWAGLCVSGFVSLRAATRRRRFWFALGPLVFGLIGVLASIPLSMEGERFRLSLDFRWFFVVPLLFGITGVALWWRLRHESVA
jgi:hypothetical protein